MLMPGEFNPSPWPDNGRSSFCRDDRMGTLRVQGNSGGAGRGGVTARVVHEVSVSAVGNNMAEHSQAGQTPGPGFFSHTSSENWF